MDIIINFRLVTMQDADLLLEWRNDPGTRKASQNTGRIKKKEHLSWLTKTLNNNNRKVYIAEENGLPVGIVRSDFHDGFYELSWTIAPNARGRGIGKIMVAKLVNRISEPIQAKIKEGNKASVSIAEYAGLEYDRKNNGFLYYKKTELKKGKYNTEAAL